MTTEQQLPSDPLLSFMPTDSTLTTDFKQELARLVSFTSDIGLASQAAKTNQEATIQDRQTVALAAEAIQELPRQYQQLQELLRADFTGSLHNQHTALLEVATEWAATLQQHLLAATTQLNDFNSSLIGDLDDRVKTITEQARQTIQTAEKATHDQFTTLASLRQQHENTLLAQDKLLGNKLTEWGQLLEAHTQRALQGIETAGQQLRDLTENWRNGTQQHETALAKAGDELNRILLGLNRFRDELDAARFVARLETLTVGLEQTRTQGQAQHTGLLSELGELKTSSQQHRQQLDQLATSQQQADGQLQRQLDEVQRELTSPDSSLRAVFQSLGRQHEATQAHVVALQGELASFQRRTQRLQLALLGGVAVVIGLAAVILAHHP